MAEPALQQEESVSDKISRMYHLREDIRRIEAEAKGLKTMFKAIEQDVMTYLDDQDLTKTGSEVAVVSLSQTDVPNVDPEHWEDVWTYCFDNGYTELFRKQLNATPWEELLRMGIEIPHVTAIAKKKLNLRKA